MATRLLLTVSLALLGALGITVIFPVPWSYVMSFIWGLYLGHIMAVSKEDY